MNYGAVAREFALQPLQPIGCCLWQLTIKYAPVRFAEPAVVVVEQEEQEVILADLKAVLAARHDDDAKVVFDTEGGFRFCPSIRPTDADGTIA